MVKAQFYEKGLKSNYIHPDLSLFAELVEKIYGTPSELCFSSLNFA